MASGVPESLTSELQLMWVWCWDLYVAPLWDAPPVELLAALAPPLAFRLASRLPQWGQTWDYRISDRATFPGLFQQSKSRDTVRRAHVDLTVGDRRRDKFVTSTKLVAPGGCLITVV